MPVNRSVAALTPLAAVAAGVSAEWLARHFPGVNVPASALEEVFLGGMASVVAPSAVWLLGWQKHEAREGPSADRFEAALQSHELAFGADELPPELDELDSAGPPFLDDDDAEPELDEPAAIELDAVAELDAEGESELDDEELDDPLDEAAVDADDEDEDEELLAEFSDSNSTSMVG